MGTIESLHATHNLKQNKSIQSASSELPQTAEVPIIQLIPSRRHHPPPLKTLTWGHPHCQALHSLSRSNLTCLPPRSRPLQALLRHLRHGKGVGSPPKETFIPKGGSYTSSRFPMWVTTTMVTRVEEMVESLVEGHHSRPEPLARRSLFT